MLVALVQTFVWELVHALMIHHGSKKEAGPEARGGPELCPSGAFSRFKLLHISGAADGRSEQPSQYSLDFSLIDKITVTCSSICRSSEIQTNSLSDLLKFEITGYV